MAEPLPQYTDLKKRNQRMENAAKNIEEWLERGESDDFIRSHLRDDGFSDDNIVDIINAARLVILAKKIDSEGDV